ncbi:MAG: hypothetical protein KGZ58_05680 [Ignavibacteriales bacterium]|nr:hypothetical protein [Ignavibacteriales bacterium]
MPSIAKQYEIYLPILYNDGTEIETGKFDTIEQELVEQFGGVTAMQRQFPLKGMWKGERQTYLDKIVVFTVVDFRGSVGQDFFTHYKEELKQRFQQEEILITAHDLTVI